MKFDISLPLLGFENIKQVELQKVDEVFMKMYSSENQNISFTLINPYVLREYDFEVPQNVLDLLSITKESNLLILNIVLIQTPIEDSVVNFIGPLIFNTDTKQAVQIILSETTEYGVAEKISSFLNKKS
ncbi:MAG: flagellar assembly protein FliW [Campylobacterota bacterium]|nr:flagellar assembly protein FliW [Campylobacterota bacterium]